VLRLRREEEAMVKQEEPLDEDEAEDEDED
jgi:hypothetical protein